MKRLSTFIMILFILSCKTNPDKSNIAIVIHGGAGTILKENMSAELEKAYRTKLEEADRKSVV